MNAPALRIDTPSAADIAALERDAIRQHTDAPLRMQGSFVFNEAIEPLFERFTDPTLIAGWFGMLKGGEIDHSASCNVGAWGEGTKRYCQTRGMGMLVETILYWDAPRAYAYNVKNFMMPVDNHAALMTFDKIGPERTRFGWFQYFDFTGLVMRHFFPTMMLSMMNKGLAHLREQIGGEPGEMIMVK